MTAMNLELEQPRRLLPNTPVFSWASLRPTAPNRLAAFDELPYRRLTSSGRAALYWALRRLDLAPGTGVLVPAYHCPTMVAPILLAGLQPLYYEITPQGSPQLDSLKRVDEQPAAMICAHFFGLPRSLAAVRAWCDAEGVALIEDCAHSFFGLAGERPVGQWGDFATASITKFFPAPECGLLASTRSDWIGPVLRPQAPLAELKGLVDVLEISARNGGLPGLNTLLHGLFALKRARKASPGEPQGEAPQEAEPLLRFDAEELMQRSDMARIDAAPLAMSKLIYRALGRQRIVANRQRNFDLYCQHFDGLNQAQALIDESVVTALAPYVFPLLIDDAERVYAEARRLGLPVFRWDRLWPGIPDHTSHQSRHWSQHMLQLICHQDLSASDIESTAHTLRRLLRA